MICRSRRSISSIPLDPINPIGSKRLRDYAIRSRRAIMAKQTTINETTAIQSAESLEKETVPMVEAEQVEQVTEVTEPTESTKLDPTSMPTGVIIQAILSSTF